MHTFGISRLEFKKIVRETFVEVLTDRKDLIEDAVAEAIEDIGLARAMEEGWTGEYVDPKEFQSKLDSKIKHTQ